MAAGNQLGKLWKYVLVVVLAVAAIGVAAVALNHHVSAPAPVDPSAQAKAAAYSEDIKVQMDADQKAAAEALLVKLKFPADRPLRVLFAGDSLSGGYFASTQSKGFTKLVSANLAKHGRVEEVRGPNTGGKVDTLGGLKSIPSGLDLAILQVGTVEVGEKDDPTQFGQEYETVLRNMKARSPKVGIVCVSTWQSTGINASGYDNIIRQKCQAAGGQFVSITSVFGDSRNRGPAGKDTWAGLSDAFHPNDTGHEAIANAVLRRLSIS